MQNFIDLYELLMPCLRKYPKHKNCSESPRTLCHRLCTGSGSGWGLYAEKLWIMIICHGAILQYCNMSFKTIAGRSDGVF